MAYTPKLAAGDTFPTVTAKLLDGSSIELGKPHSGADWQMLVGYRGRHCPMCTSYLNQLEEHKTALGNLGVSVVAVSADTEARLKEHMQEFDVSFPVAYGLTEEQMQTLGLYISNPREGLECDYKFAEPGLFVINEKGKIQTLDISHAPFLRPELSVLVGGLGFIRNPENNYPIRGTAPYK